MHPKTPETAKRAWDFIMAVETATAEAPVSLDILTGEDTTIPELLGQHFKAARKLEKRHAKLFFQGWLEDDGAGPDAPDPGAVLALTKDVLVTSRRLQVLKWSTWLGHGVLQLAEAGARIAHDPSLIRAEGEDRQEVAMRKAGDLLSNSFQASYADRVIGDASRLPDTARASFLGILLDTHYRFWRTQLGFERLGFTHTLPTEIGEEAKKLLCQYPAKVMLADVHTLQGRPGPKLLRKVYKKRMAAYERSMTESGVARGVNMRSNLSDATDIVTMVLEACTQAGYSSDESQRIVVDNSNTIGRLIERFETLENDIHFQGPKDQPRLVIDYSDRLYELPFPGAEAKLKPRDQKGSVCPVRHFVRLRPDGETHQKVKLFSNSVAEHVGAEPSYLHHTRKGIFLDPAALMINYALLPYALARG
jgi:hypothetical protein